MEFKAKLRHWGIAAASVLSTAALIWYGTGLHPYWPLLWFAPLPVLLFSTTTNRRTAALTAFAGMTLGMCNLLAYFAELGVPIVVRFVVLGTQGALFALATVVFREFLTNRACWRALVAFPATWVVLEWALSLVSPHGTFANISYSQLEFLPFLQLASLTGPWGMSFILFLFPAAIAICNFQYKNSPRSSIAIALTVSLSLGAVLLWGQARLEQPLAAHRVSVALLASDGSNIGTLEPGEATEKLFVEYIEHAEPLVAQGARVVVLPEKLGVVIEANKNTADAIFQPFVNRTHSVLIAGMVSVVENKKFNEARVYRPSLPVLRYEKEHMLPPFESYLTPGTRLTHFEMPSGIWGVAICKDMDFTDPARGYGKADVGLLLVPAWDFSQDWFLHGHMAIMRGVESGFSIARAAKGGSMYASDSRGRILAESMSNAAPFSSLVVDVQVSNEPTVYRRWGDWFAWVMVVYVLLATASLGRDRNNLT